MRLWVRNSSLSLFFFALFVGATIGQSIAGQKVFNEEALAHGGETISYWRYLVSSHFAEAMAENWQSEYLQFTLFILATVWLIQRGSNESKPPEDAGRESDARQLVGEHAQRNSPRWAKVGGWRTRLYSNSLLLVMLAIFFASWLAQAVAGRNEYNEEQRDHGEAAVSLGGYLAGPTSGRRRSRTGSRSFSPSGRWPCSRSTSGSAGRRSRSRWALRTTRPAPRDERDRAAAAHRGRMS
jgi:hypothetical protein